MIVSITDAISIALFEEFGYENHSERVEQGFVEPCFFISCIDSSIRQFFGKKYYYNNQYCIQYFPGTKDINRECNDTAERMMWCLEQITVDDSLMRGTGMKYQMEDGVLQFFIHYDCYIYTKSGKDEETKMEETKLIQEVKG